MTEVDRQGSDLDLTYDTSQPGKYIPLDKVDRAKYDVIHPENAMSKLKMSARTAYRKIDSGELEYTLDKGSKRILVRKDQSLSDLNHSNVSHISGRDQLRSDNVSDISNMSPVVEKLLESLPDYKEQLTEKEEDLRQWGEKYARLQDELERLKSKYTEELKVVRHECQTRLDEFRKEKDTAAAQLRDNIDLLKNKHQEELRTTRLAAQAEIDQLKADLETERVSKARMEGEIKRIDTIEITVNAQQETISSQKTTIDALNNERIVITQQLQKYRGVEQGSDETAVNAPKKPIWKFW